MVKNDVKIKKSRNPITGIINVTGEPDSGKTLFAFSNGAAPERTAFIDDDVKGKNIVKGVERQGRQFGYYMNLMRESKGMRELDFHKLCMGILDELEQRKGEFDVIIWDTWTRFENTFQPYVHANPTKFKQFYSAMGQIKGAEEWGASFEYEAKTLDAMTEIAPLVILTSHLKKDATKRDIAESKKPLIQKSAMRVYLRHTAGSPLPTGLMLKRLADVDVSSGKIEPINVTHRKMSPFTWERLLYYWENPVGNQSPGKDEELNEFEISILDNILTKDQKDVLRLAVIEAEREREEEARNAKLLKHAAGVGKSPKNRNVPINAIQLYTEAMEKYGVDGEQVEKIAKVSTEELMDFDEEQIKEVWEKIGARSSKNK